MRMTRNLVGGIALAWATGAGAATVVDFGAEGVGGYPEIEVTGVTAPAKVRVVYATHPDGLGERGDFWHETRATYMGPEVWLPILPANTDRFDVFDVPSNGVYRAPLAQGLLRYGYEKDARRIAKKYSQMVERVFAETGSLWEKYDVTTGKVSVSREYETPKMLGWSAGVYLAFARLLEGTDANE